MKPSLQEILAIIESVPELDEVREQDEFNMGVWSHNADRALTEVYDHVMAEVYKEDK